MANNSRAFQAYFLPSELALRRRPAPEILRYEGLYSKCYLANKSGGFRSDADLLIYIRACFPWQMLLIRHSRAMVTTVVTRLLKHEYK